MVQLPVKVEEIREWLPETYKVFVEELRNSKSRSANKPDEKIEWLISWGFFGKKAKNEEQAIQKQIDFEAKLKLPYEERVKEDLPKIRINVSMRAGYYIRTDRAFDMEIPKFIIDMSYEILKITMLQEQMILNDPIVKESLKEFEYLLEGIQEFDEEGKPKSKKETPLSMDDILDKISETGMGSLSARELKFLEQMSRG